MITFNYQGRQVEGELVGYVSGDFTPVVRGDFSITHQGDERLYRDAESRYYLLRTLDWWDLEGSTKHRASGRVHCHRLSLLAALLWTAMRCQPDTNHLRQDAAALITKLPKAEAAYSSVNPNEVTVPLTLPVDLYRQVLAMSAYDNGIGFVRSGNFNERVVHALEGEARMWLGTPDESPSPAEFLASYEAKLDAGKHPEAWPPQRASTPVIGSHSHLAAFGWLDDHAAKLVGEHLARKPDQDVRDLLNGALRFLLEDTEAEGVAWETNHQAVAEAMRYRLAGSEPPKDGKIPNVATLALVPADFHQFASKLGYTVEEYLWMLAEDACAVPLESVEPVVQGERVIDEDEDEEEPASILDLLEPMTGMEVARYLFVTPWEYKAVDVVSGCAQYALKQAFAALAHRHNGKAPDDEGFVDNGWGYVEEEICDAAWKRNGGQLIQLKASRSQDAKENNAEEAEDAPLEILDLPPADEDADDTPFVARDLRHLPAANRSDAAVAAAASAPPPPPPSKEKPGQQAQPQQEGGK